MAKIKTSFFCKNCGSQSSKWLGRCPTCQEWDTFIEEVIERDDTAKGEWRVGNLSKKVEKAQKIDEIQNASENRYITKDGELNRVLGGGLVEGSLILIGGSQVLAKALFCCNWPLK